MVPPLPSKASKLSNGETGVHGMGKVQQFWLASLQPAPLPVAGRGVLAIHHAKLATYRWPKMRTLSNVAHSDIGYLLKPGLTGYFGVALGQHSTRTVMVFATHGYGLKGRNHRGRRLFDVWFRRKGRGRVAICRGQGFTPFPRSQSRADGGLSRTIPASL
jgi:hypothetical protein